jgi:hypothetical protein
MTAWETYKPVKSTRVSLEPKVTIRGGKFSFNAYLRTNVLKGYQFATLLYDKKAKKIGIQLKKEKDESTLKLSTTKSNSTFLNALPFFTQYGLDTSETKAYPVTIDKDMLIIDLNKAEAVNYSPRTTTKKEEADSAGEKPTE